MEAVKSDGDLTLKAFWPDRRRVQPGRDAQLFLDAAAIRFGENPVYIRQSVARNTLAARMILAMLGLTREAVFPRNRPIDTPRARLVASVVAALLNAGRTEPEAFAQAPKYLADPGLRSRTRIGHGEGEALGKGRKLLTSQAECRSYRDTKKQGLIAKLYFVAPGEPDESAIALRE
ncbi:MAG: hypothetical protein Q7T93_13920 [Methylobacterium sp.]|uniref:hypothetical protein n=1 Tax=Methylobacterium sp. TaxID=409 RepID=UPI00271C52F8|nr:hypothetical protein [Methylobacterium sp.]MDO9427913.1 hypothetical protein [Methylobacterium sp.]